MRKYLRFIKIEFEAFFEYRGDLALSFGIKLFIFLSFVFVWKSISDAGYKIGNYGFEGIVLYYLLTQIFDGFRTSQAAKDLRGDILEGTLSNKLIKPFKSYIYFFIRNLSRIIFEVVFNSILSIPIFLVWNSILQSFKIDFLSIVQFCVFLIFIIIFNFNLFLLVGIIAFWTKQASGFQVLVKNGTRFFTGALIPIDLLPLKVQNIINLLPFPYLLFFPIKILLENIGLRSYFRALIIIVIWTLLLIFINIYLWKKGLKKYEAVGI